MNMQEAKEKLEAYKTKKLAPGGFLTSILCNDLTSAVLKADDESKAHIVSITKHCWENLPNNIWGSREKFDNHIGGINKGITPQDVSM